MFPSPWREGLSSVALAEEGIFSLRSQPPSPELKWRLNYGEVGKGRGICFSTLIADFLRSEASRRIGPNPSTTPMAWLRINY